ncbi:MAG: class I SAM-dependent methyltransferase [Candidatus Taylorbacteria bacterium]|nr:class I SAM-dependent methyltransferase [Candidatus Taylorbacteria bacterium]
MNGFFDFQKLSDGQSKQILKVLKRSNESRASVHEALEPLLDDFHKFLFEVLNAVRVRCQKNGSIESMFDLKIPYDPKVEPERFIRDGWNAWANLWPLIETASTYQLTMLTILEKFHVPKSGRMRLVSLGSGPGIYETFFARLLQNAMIDSKVTCVDLVPQMGKVQEFIVNLNPPQLRNIDIITSDMSSVPLPNGCADAVLCNNALQWNRQWRKAICEMRRLLDPDSDRLLYLFVHTHKQAMHVKTSTGENVVEMEPILVPEIMDELENNSFTIRNTRQIRGGDGAGQLGGQLDRAFILAELTHWGPEYSWRKAKVNIAAASLMKLGK